MTHKVTRGQRKLLGNRVPLDLFRSAMTEDQKCYLEMVSCGKLSVSVEGVIVNTLTGNALGNNHPRGYVSLSVWWKDKKRYCTAHVLVYLVHHGLLEEGMTVNHKDGNKKNNKADNLEALSFLDNMKHAYKNKLIDIPYRNAKIKEAYEKKAMG